MKTRRQLRSVLRRLLAPAHLPMRVTLAFLLVSSLWLLFSPDGGWLLAFGVTALSAVLLYLLVRREMSAAGDAVQEKEQLLRQLTEHIDEVFWLADATTGQIRYVSPAYEKIWERPRSAIIGAAAIWQDTLHPDDRGSVLGTAGQPAPAPQDYRYRIIRGDSAVRWIQEHTFPVYDEAGTIRRIAGIAQDITTRVSDPEFLDLLVDERTRRFRTLLDGSQRIASVAPALQLDLLPGMILEQLAAIVEFTSASIYTVENGYLRPLASRGTEQAPEPLQTSRLSHQPALSALAADEKPLVIPDLQAETTLVRVVRDAFGQGVREAGAWIGVPLITPSAIGLLVADHLQTGYFTPERTELIVAFASQAAGALESARLFERTQQRVAEAEGLQRVTLALVQKHSLEELLAIICREAWRLIGASGSFILLKEDEQQLRLAYRDERLSGLAERIPIATTHTGRAIRQGQPVVVDGEEAYRAGTTHADPAIKTLLVMPLRVDEEVIGALDVINKPGGFTDDDVRTIGHFADAAALAIERARLQRQREQLAVMR